MQLVCEREGMPQQPAYSTQKIILPALCPNPKKKGAVSQQLGRSHTEHAHSLDYVKGPPGSSFEVCLPFSPSFVGSKI